MKPAAEDLIPAITLHRPWALWVCAGWKTIETRLHNHFQSLLGKRIAIHAGLEWDNTAITKAAQWLDDDRLQITAALQQSRVRAGEIVATAFVSRFGLLTPAAEKLAMIQCKTKRFGLQLEDIQPVISPKMRGFQGIFNVRRGILVPVQNGNPPLAV